MYPSNGAGIGWMMRGLCMHGGAANCIGMDMVHRCSTSMRFLYLLASRKRMLNEMYWRVEMMDCIKLLNEHCSVLVYLV
jgi:hypothetical protein